MASEEQEKPALSEEIELSVGELFLSLIHI